MTTETTTLTAWLLAQIAADEAWARRFADEEVIIRWNPIEWGTRPLLSTAVVSPGHPARVLAECAAKRRIVGLHEVRDPQAARPICDQDRFMGDADYPCKTLRALAAVYADYEGFREEWRP